ncbi:MAG: hypothetical protein U0791_01225 [Gemmataceae bacterium]
MARRGIWLLGTLFATGFAVAGVVWATWPVSPPPIDWSGEYNTAPRPPEEASNVSADAPVRYDLTSKPADSMEPGTVVEKTAPKGWSHLVIKSLPRVREDQKAGIPELTVEKASWMFTAFVANVAKDENGRYRFDKAALGLGAKAKERDTILTAETGRKLGGDLGLFGGEILNKGYEVQKKAVLVFSGPSLALLDTPVWFRVGDENKLVRYRYAMVVDQLSGRMEVLLWRVGTDGVGTSFDDAVWLKPDTVDVAELVVDKKKVNRFGIPADDAFAVDKMPAGQKTPIPAELQKLAAQTRFTADEAYALDVGLRKLFVKKE